MATVAAQVLLKHGIRPATMIQFRQPKTLVELIKTDPNHGIGKYVSKCGTKLDEKKQAVEYYQITKVKFNSQVSG
jgi:hypothetical protein